MAGLWKCMWPDNQRNKHETFLMNGKTGNWEQERRFLQGENKENIIQEGKKVANVTQYKKKNKGSCTSYYK